jgi:hypothetical protein
VGGVGVSPGVLLTGVAEALVVVAEIEKIEALFQIRRI